MSISAVNFKIPPEFSRAMRYERVAQLEAVINLREKKQRAAMVRWALVGISMLGAAAVGISWWFAA